MSDLILQDKLNTAARSLSSSKTQALNAIAQLKAIKTNLANLKTSVNNDGDFDQAAVDSVQTVITDLLAEIDTI